MIPDKITTERLYLQRLAVEDKLFILALLNTPGWLSFIGDRKVRTAAAAENYILQILANNAIQYWVVRLPGGDTPVGVVTLIKRAYLDHHDIGFAFLPSAGGKGYAYEAASAVLHAVMNDGHQTILATTAKTNIASIALLRKLGLALHSEIIVEAQPLLLYKITA